jgi:hypothetical protein
VKVLVELAPDIMLSLHEDADRARQEILRGIEGWAAKDGSAWLAADEHSDAVANPNLVPAKLLLPRRTPDSEEPSPPETT